MSYTSGKRPLVPKLSEKKCNVLFVPCCKRSQASDPLPAFLTTCRYFYKYVMHVSPLQRINTLIHYWTDGHPVLLPEGCSPPVSHDFAPCRRRVFCTAHASLRNVSTSSAVTTYALAFLVMSNFGGTILRATLCCARSLNGDQGSLHHQQLRTATRRLRCSSCFLLPNVLTTVPNLLPHIKCLMSFRAHSR